MKFSRLPLEQVSSSLNLSKDLPTTVSLNGVDIQPRLLPVHHPPNVSFLSHSVTDLPKSWNNKFKLIINDYYPLHLQLSSRNRLYRNSIESLSREGGYWRLVQR
ncbi:hypothetical protein BT96DRAFT_186928 [Gymnopus androsaceus JB14]|uniref:Uncharacterized protein n=1 Tax=Gymnopus androsaceus JB14 TaxID=1447944 RepID=A0A6A4HB01_9AGAR|nr:hypothetical protein BT96DRAFT_186928 [Gymnopus androsaceus JB14]